MGSDLDVEAVRARLLADRDDVLQQLRGLGASFDDIVDAARWSNLDDEHDPEGSTIALERSMVSSLSRSAEQRLVEIDAALARLTDGSYGRCSQCGQPIPDGRLAARPTATTCVGCVRPSR